MGGKSRKCEICGVRERQRPGFFANFPIDESRCRTWLQIVGNEDLVHVPIEKLHELRHICGDHFEKKDFSKKGKRLKKKAFPKFNLSASPLYDHQLRQFPLHVASKSGVCSIHALDDHRKMFYQCCVPFCESRRSTVKLHKFPRSEIALKKWLDCIRCEYLQSLESSRLDKLHVCHKHFEDRFKTSSSRIRGYAYPTLFTPEEIVSGKPATVFEDVGTSILIDTAHNDHNYSIRAKATRSTITNVADNSAAEASQADEDGFNDNDFNDVALRPTATEYEEVAHRIFSWQKDTDLLPTEIMDDDNDTITCPSVGEAVDLMGPADFSMYCDDEPKPSKSQPEPIQSPEHPAEYQCNECRKEIMGFRYTCVQCADWDLCGACEARTAHGAHYVLRVPGPRPYNEIQAVLTAIRQQLLSENLFLNQQFPDDSLKAEVKEEPPEAPPAAPEPAPAPDPLEASSDSDSDYRGDNTQTEDSSEESAAGCSPRHKRRSHRSLRSAKTDGNSAIVTREKPVLTAQGDATIADHIDLTEATVSEDATNTPLCHKPPRILTSDKPARHPTHQILAKSLAQDPVKATAPDSILRVLAYNKARLEQSKNPTDLFAAKNHTRSPGYEYTKRISTFSKPITKLAFYKPTRLLTSNSSTKKLVHDYLTKRASEDTRRLAEAVPAPHRTLQPTDDVICLDDTSTEKLNTVKNHVDPIQSQPLGSNIDTLQASEGPDRVESHLVSPSRPPDAHHTIVLRVPSDTNEVDLARALQSNVIVRLEPLQVKVIDYIPARKKRRLKSKHINYDEN